MRRGRNYGASLLNALIRCGPRLPSATVDHASLRPPFADAQGSIVAASTYLSVPLTINRQDEYGIPGTTDAGGASDRPQPMRTAVGDMNS